MSPVNIHGAEYSISRIFSNDFVFSIPGYQRPYAWTTEHAGELFDDLLAFMGDGDKAVSELDPYFLGSIVLIKGDEPLAEVVDGQQRLTTLTILLAVIREMVSPTFATAVSKLLYEEGDILMQNPDRPRLTLRKRDAAFFREHIQEEGGLSKLKALENAKLPDAKNNIWENALHLLQKIAAIPQAKRERLAQFIVSRCFLVVVSTPDLESAYRIFSVLNDRGMDLSLTDILKAEILGKLTNEVERNAYTQIWEDIEVDLGRDAFEELFSHIRMIYRKAKYRESILKEVRMYVKPAEAPKTFIDETLRPLAEAFDTIKQADYQSKTQAEQVNGLLILLSRIDNSDWLPPAIDYMMRYRNQPFNLIEFLTDLERLAAGLMIRRADINERFERYGRVLAAIENGDDLKVDSSPLQLSTEEKTEIKQALNGNLYLLRNVPRYVLLRLDGALADGSANYDLPIVSIEHVLPQNPAADSEWLTWFPDQEQREAYVHRLGNLVPLSRRKNSKASNYDFATKKQKYFSRNGGVSPFVLTTEVLQEKQWTPGVIERRQKSLLAKLTDIWRL